MRYSVYEASPLSEGLAARRVERVSLSAKCATLASNLGPPRASAEPSILTRAVQTPKRVSMDIAR